MLAVTSRARPGATMTPRLMTGCGFVGCSLQAEGASGVVGAASTTRASSARGRSRTDLALAGLFLLTRSVRVRRPRGVTATWRSTSPSLRSSGTCSTAAACPRSRRSQRHIQRRVRNGERLVEHRLVQAEAHRRNRGRELLLRRHAHAERAVDHDVQVTDVVPADLDLRQLVRPAPEHERADGRRPVRLGSPVVQVVAPALGAPPQAPIRPAAGRIAGARPEAAPRSGGGSSSPAARACARFGGGGSGGRAPTAPRGAAAARAHPLAAFVLHGDRATTSLGRPHQAADSIASSRDGRS